LEYSPISGNLAVPFLGESMDVNFLAIGILSVQCVLVSVLILILFRLKGLLGIGSIYAVVGLFQFMMVFIASTLYLRITDDFVVSPGSCVLFTGSLFAVLLIYIREDAMETRKIVYALVIANVITSLLLYTFGWSHNNLDILSPSGYTVDLFNMNAWILIAGTVTMVIDVVLLILLYELFSRFVKKCLFLRIYLIMALVLSFDAFCFTTLSFWHSDLYGSILISGLISKNGAALIYAFLFWLYLRFIEKEGYVSTVTTFKDIFYFISYRQIYELAKKKKKISRKDAEKVIQHSQVRYDTLVGSSPVGVFLTDADGATVYVNPQWCVISGMNEFEALGWGWLNALHPNDRRPAGHGWKLATDQKTSSYTSYRFLHKDGTVRWVLGQAIPERDDDGKLLGYVGTITDITEIKNYEEELNISKGKAEESDRLKTAFLQNLSHEIRTPMNAIQGFSELLKNPDMPEEKRDMYVSIIQKSSNQLVSIVSDIMTISSLETKQETLNLEEIKVNEILDDLLISFKQQATSKNLSLFVTKSLTDEQSVIQTDRTKLIQVLSNLLSNALKFTKSGFIEFGYIQSGNELKFHVRDTGIGIRKESMALIFGRFVQADLSIQKNYGGTGLGLSISKGFIELMGGTIWVDSVFGEGTTFYFTLPGQKK
jgi:PAS domain S-box-containing protein